MHTAPGNCPCLSRPPGCRLRGHHPHKVQQEPHAGWLACVEQLHHRRVPLGLMRHCVAPQGNGKRARARSPAVAPPASAPPPTPHQGGSVLTPAGAQTHDARACCTSMRPRSRSSAHRLALDLLFQGNQPPSRDLARCHCRCHGRTCRQTVALRPVGRAAGSRRAAPRARKLVQPYPSKHSTVGMARWTRCCVPANRCVFLTHPGLVHCPPLDPWTRVCPRWPASQHAPTYLLLLPACWQPPGVGRCHLCART